MIESIKNIEKVQDKLEQQKKKYDESKTIYLESVQLLSTKISDLKGKAAKKNIELKSSIKSLDEQIAEKIHSTLSDENSQEELRKLSIEMDVLKRQETAISTSQRKTIIINCKKEIEKTKQAFKEVSIQQHTLYLIYEKLFKSINDVTGELNNILKTKTEEYYPFYSAVVNVTTKDSISEKMKPLAEYLFDTNIKDPGNKNDDNGETAYDVLTNYYVHEVYPEIVPEAKKRIDKLI